MFVWSRMNKRVKIGGFIVYEKLGVGEEIFFYKEMYKRNKK